MPREYVRGQVRILENRDADGSTPEDVEDLVAIGWQKEAGWVQIGTMSRATVTHDTIEEGYFVDLDRRRINELIRRLRKARDDAFGRDE